MDYYKLLQLEREPFSNSPDPEYFFQSHQHLGCIQKLELAMRLKRGLNVVIGDVGTGKTTLCRELIRRFSVQPEFETHLILDPSFDSPTDFLATICAMISGTRPGASLSLSDIKERIKLALFSKGVDQNFTVVLIIDEGQKIPSASIELLRELLNFETNEHKLLQIVIFAQHEFEAILRTHANFADRVNLLHRLEPMSFSDTRQMIRFRLSHAGKERRSADIFTLPALWSIYRASRGYPRKIINLCHQSVLAMIIQNRSRVGWRVIRSCRNRLRPNLERRPVYWITVSFIVLSGCAVAAHYFYGNHWPLSGAIQRFKVPEQTTPGTMTSIPIASPQSPASTMAADPAPAPTSQPENESAASTAAQRDTPATPFNAPMPPDTGAPLKTPPASATSISPPDTLGKVRVQPGDTLVSLVRKVYGGYRHRLLKAVIDFNPQLRDPNDIEIGETILFPAIEFGADEPPPEKVYWIALDERSSLAEVLSRQIEITSHYRLASRVVTSWSAATGFRFNLTTPKPFLIRTAADDFLSRIPVEASSRARIIEGWPTDTPLYSLWFASNSKIQEE
jgi:general secretion pathway protein A